MCAACKLIGSAQSSFIFLSRGDGTSWVCVCEFARFCNCSCRCSLTLCYCVSNANRLHSPRAANVNNILTRCAPCILYCAAYNQLLLELVHAAKQVSNFSWMRINETWHYKWKIIDVHSSNFLLFATFSSRRVLSALPQIELWSHW